MGYADSNVLVSTDWVAKHLSDPNVVLVEVNVDTTEYAIGHIPGAVALNWATELQERVERNVVGRAAFARLMSVRGISRADTVIVYGDNNNWFAAYAFWILKLYGHADVRVLDGGRAKWMREPGRPMTSEPTVRTPAAYMSDDPDLSIRALFPDVEAAVENGGTTLVDVRTREEFDGLMIAPPGTNETAQRAGHIPGAKHIPWIRAVAEAGTFRSAQELRDIYLDEHDIDPAQPAIAYCRIGERSSHTWFVLKYLIGIPDVKNYDGSWTEYGSMIGVPITNPTAAAI